MNYSYISNADPKYIDQLYQKYLINPESVEEAWRLFFEGFSFSKEGNISETISSEVGNPAHIQKELSVRSLIGNYRYHGHLLSDTNPIRQRKDRKAGLELEKYGLDNSDLATTFQAGKELGLNNATLTEIIAALKKIYCGHIGYEFQYIECKEEREWLRNKIEQTQSMTNFDLNIKEKKRIIETLNGAEVFERFLHTKYVGQKRFSLEGGDATITALDAMINASSDRGVQEIIIGMAHRGRLNVLANILKKTYAQIFNEFEGNIDPSQSFGDGDVKYHLGFSSIVKSSNNKEVQLKLVPNPSHLEAVNPVVEGFSRAKGDLIYNNDYDKILPILIHGDAAVVGQGVVYETAQMSKLEGYYTGGSLHFVINNQIGFTTDFDDARSSTYCTGAANVIQAPVFHVNGDDPEALVFVVKLAIEYRQKFNSDVYIDMVCYRKHGHNEGDDPKFTQPKLYDIINNHPSARKLYSEKLIASGDLEKKLAEDMEGQFWSFLQERLDEVKQKTLPYKYQEPELQWKELKATMDPKDFEKSPLTGIDRASIDKILDHISKPPEGMEIISKMKRVFKGQNKILDQGVLNWGIAELLAYGSILTENKNVRMSGQDVKRGTFSHRHAVLNDNKTFEPYNRLANIQEEQGDYMIYNSLLSEFAVLGFEFGYSMATPNSLVVWEAQFGDFFNGAQVMMDQFILASESKWKRMSGLVLLLPHGYEGQGPEHSSARLERFLQSCADYNITVANITTPSNLFHALRRQLARDFRKPLVIMSPKSLLRHPSCVSPISEFETKNGFNELIDDTVATKARTTNLLFCSGKIYYDLVHYRETHKITNTAIVRIEQLYPFPQNQVQAILNKYSKASVKWVQEEPRNMGAASFIYERMGGNIRVISRKASSSTATGFKHVHEKQQTEIMDKAFDIK